jgi:glycosyltransferase involved in cell wall biosynthesis
MEPSHSLSVVVPVHNEEAILAEQVTAMAEALLRLGLEFEVVVVENGSTDRTLAVGREVAAGWPQVRVIQLPVGDYGVALRQGILEARFDVVVIFNVEFWSIEFVQAALPELQSYVLIIGSKSAPGADDQRPWLRRRITGAYNQLLRTVWAYRGTDTHGMKAFWRRALLPLVQECLTTGFVFDTELVLRAQYAGLSKKELPTDVRELRTPSYASLARRVRPVLANLWILWRHLPRPARSSGQPARSTS